MEDESEKRFHAIMDKLFRSPPKSKSTSTTTTPAPNSTSSPGVQLTIGQKRPNVSSALAVTEPKGLRNSLVSGKPLQTPLCRPWDRGDLMRRLATFKSMTWFAKPKVVSPVNCARRGWVNVETDTIACESCGVRLLFSTPSSWSQQQVEKAASVFSLKLDNGHKLLCPWIDNACAENLAQFPPMLDAALLDDYKKRFSALLRLLALPLISSSAIACITSPQLEHFLTETSTVGCGNQSAVPSRTEYLGNECDTDSSVLYYQAQKLISLFGWEPRILPYIVDCKNQHDFPRIDASRSDSFHPPASSLSPSITVYSSGTNNSLEANDDLMSSNGTESYQNSVVLDCRFCGASVGLWTLSTVPRPLEVFRLVGYTELDGDNNSNHNEERAVHCEGGASGAHISANETKDVSEGVTESATTIATPSKERPLNLSLTIAGGPPPTKQKFRAMISLPVVGRNLRARISDDIECRNRLHVRKTFWGGEGNAENTLSRKGSQPEYLESSQTKGYDGNHCESNDQLQHLKYDTIGRDDKHENEDNFIKSIEGASISGEGFPENCTTDSIMETPPQNIPNLIEDPANDGALSGNTNTDGTANPVVGDNCCSPVGESLLTNSVVHVSISNEEPYEIERNRGEGVPETSRTDFIMGNAPQSVQDTVKVNELPENANSDRTVNQAVGNHTQMGDSSIVTPAAHVTSRNVETNESERSIQVGNSQQNPETDTVGRREVGNCHVNEIKDIMQYAKRDTPFCSGKNLGDQQFDKAMMFDPIRQHRHFCPWITSVGSAAPGWQQTLSALQRQKEFSCPIPAQASFPLIEVDDPVASVKNLFMSPSAKRMKMTRDSS